MTKPCIAPRALTRYCTDSAEDFRNAADHSSIIPAPIPYSVNADADIHGPTSTLNYSPLPEPGAPEPASSSGTPGGPAVPSADGYNGPPTQQASGANEADSPPSVSHDATAEEEDEDVLPRTKSMYRLLELYSEQGSAGLVEKVLISKDSLYDLIEALSPGSSPSMTNVSTDFCNVESLPEHC